jgi:hypothetical protein
MSDDQMEVDVDKLLKVIRLAIEELKARVGGQSHFLSIGFGKSIAPKGTFSISSRLGTQSVPTRMRGKESKIRLMMAR